MDRQHRHSLNRNRRDRAAMVQINVLQRVVIADAINVIVLHEQDHRHAERDWHVPRDAHGDE